MNLNKSHREEIVAAVMSDTPKRHKLSISDRLQDVVDKAITERGPEGIRHLWKDKELGRFLHRTSTCASYIFGDHYVDNVPYVSMLYGYQLDKDAKAELKALVEDHLDEIKQRAQAQTTLAAALAGIRTRKQFIEQFPELAKYAPEEIKADRSVPAIANVMSTLSKLGWPAEKQGAAA